MDLNTKIVTKTQEVKQFALNAAAAKKNDEQKIIDQNFSDIINSVNSLVSHIVHATKITSFRCSDELIIRLKDLLKNSKKLTQSGSVKTNDLYEIKKSMDEINEEASTEWQRYYVQEAKSVEEVLNLVKNIAGEEAALLMANIKSGKDWKTNGSNLEKMTLGLSNAKQLITKLGLQDKIVDFLKKMVSQKATLADLDEEILNWISREGIKSKIKIGFIR